jgi:hypothetical protein
MGDDCVVALRAMRPISGGRSGPLAFFLNPSSERDPMTAVPRGGLSPDFGCVADHPKKNSRIIRPKIGDYHEQRNGRF